MTNFSKLIDKLNTFASVDGTPGPHHLGKPSDEYEGLVDDKTFTSRDKDFIRFFKNKRPEHFEKLIDLYKNINPILGKQVLKYVDILKKY